MPSLFLTPSLIARWVPCSGLKSYPVGLSSGVVTVFHINPDSLLSHEGSKIEGNGHSR